MTVAYVGVGSNIEPCKHSEVAVKELSKLGCSLKVSTIYECEALGFDGRAFYNFVVELQTDFSLAEFSRKLREIEIDWGRKEHSAKYQDRTLDLDLILFGEEISQQDPQIPRIDIYKYPFVIQPLYELCPDRVIPSDCKSIRQVWQNSTQLDLLKPVERWFEV
ncbi:2-amino-4-hydroxy-6-hydroxymethyldihydropteridine diphosphokinase [Vibrio sp. S4M6]|uniref:2-amino-4-hydroxy-6- hydroxymethyldihydropteridine diphosphokinase n=1 Tax=Vibrio sinus TaxID=2946865 RepID=UPI002029D442|nr:2-amino-4-hydroxy-6-hydroxymethyldihydropteridine diphosphokinase [Vibrio sinus]MCL9780975.1 2-amino-4-hydroxy-6-hydroxymethyldihydropteridine diphosphokinase [Vibrio sinus]